jgi:hypothetical protein
LAVIVPFPLPEELTVHQVWSLTTVQDEFDITANEVDPAGDAGTFWLEGVTVRVGVAPACVTVTTTGEIPDTVVVILATLGVTNVLTV